MNIEITHRYDIPTRIKINKTLNLENLKENIENYFDNWNVVDEDNISEYITDYVNWDNFGKCFNNEDDFNNYIEDSSNITINNLDYLIKYFSYLIKEPELSECCRISLDKEYIYCSICGTKLQ